MTNLDKALSGSKIPVVSYTHAIPESVRKQAKKDGMACPQTISIRIINTSIQLAAQESSGGNPLKYIRNLQIASIYKVDGKLVTDDGLSAEKVFSTWHPKVWALVQSAYLAHNMNVTADEADDFLAEAVQEIE